MGPPLSREIWPYERGASDPESLTQGHQIYRCHLLSTLDQLLYNYWYSPGQRCCKNVAMGEIGDVSTLGHWGEFKMSWQLCPYPCPSYSTPYHTMRSQPFLSALAPVSAFLVYVSPHPSPPQTSHPVSFPSSHYPALGIPFPPGSAHWTPVGLPEEDWDLCHTCLCQPWPG